MASQSQWIWSESHRDYYYVTYDTNGMAIHHDSEAFVALTSDIKETLSTTSPGHSLMRPPSATSTLEI